MFAFVRALLALSTLLSFAVACGTEEPAEAHAVTLDPTSRTLEAEAESDDEEEEDLDEEAPRLPRSGELVISEILYNPAGAEPASEWFEVTSLARDALTLHGLDISSGLSSHVVEDHPVLAPGARAVFCRDVTAGPEGCLPYDAIRLNNEGIDGLTLAAPDGTLLDHVAFEDGGAFPPSLDGVSIELSESALLPWSNDAGANWCHATAAAGDDLGTPGGANRCP